MVEYYERKGGDMSLNPVSFWLEENNNPLYRGNVARKHFGENITIQYVPLVCDEYGTLWIAVDEDGLGKRLPLNFFLGEVDEKKFLETFTKKFYPVQAIVGDVLFVRTKNYNLLEEEIYDFEIVGLTNEDKQYIEKLLSEDVQARLFFFYQRLYGGDDE